MRRVKGNLVTFLTISLLAGPTAMIAAEEASALPAGPVSFTGKLAFGPCTAGTTEVIDDVVRTTTTCRPSVHGMTDTRLAGAATLDVTIDEVPGGVWLYRRAFRIVNDGGAWQQSPSSVAFEAPGEGASATTDVLVGEGAYEGLTAIAELTLDGDVWSVRGVVIEGDPPPTAELAANG